MARALAQGQGRRHDPGRLSGAREKREGRAVRAAVHADRLPAAQRGILQDRRVDAADRPHALKHQRQFVADAALAGLVETRGGRGDMGGQRDIVHAQHRVVVGWRLLLQHVERGVRDPAFLQRLDQRLLIDGGAASGVDEDRALLHLLEMVFAKHVMHLGARRGMHRHEIRLRQHFGQRRRQHAVVGNQHLLDEGIVGHHPKAKGRGALGDRTRHPAERDEAERLAHQAWDFQQRRTALGPAAFADHLVLLDQPAKTCKQQHHGVVGDFLDKGVGDVGDGNAARGGRLDVHAVDADAAERDDLAVFEGIDDRLRDRQALGVDGIGSPGGGDKFRLIGWRLDDLGADRIERFFFKRVTATGNGETRAFRRHHLEFRHFLLPIDLRSCYRRDVATASRCRRS